MIGLYILAVTCLIIICMAVWIVWFHNRGPRNFVNLHVGTEFRFGPDKGRSIYVVVETIGCGFYQVLREYNNGSDELVYMAASSVERLKDLRVFVV